MTYSPVRMAISETLIKHATFCDIVQELDRGQGIREQCYLGRY